MARLSRDKLHIKLSGEITLTDPVIPRCYTLTHSDATGDLFLTIGESHNRTQISGWYTRLMRDEVLAEWQISQGVLFLLTHCHLSGGLIFGTADWRYKIFQRELPLVLEAFRYGDRQLFAAHPECDQALVKVKFHASRIADRRVEEWGQMKQYSFVS